VDFDLEVLAEIFNVPGVILAGVVAGEVGRGNIGNRFLVDSDNLENSFVLVIHLS